MRVGIEIGGTFTDLVAAHPDGRIETWKVPSTPSAPAQAARQAILEWRGNAAGIETLVHGSTVATNAVIERKGTQTCLLVTRGHKDILEIQRHDKSRIFDLHYEKPVPIVRRNAVFEVDERLAADGTVLKPLTATDELLESVRGFLREQEGSIAICLLHSYANPAHEQALAAALRRAFPGTAITLSSEINPEQREYERASTTVLSAYLRPIIDRYMANFEREMHDNGLRGQIQIMQSSGGTIPVTAAREQAVRVVLSGPAAGVVAAAHIAGLSGFGDLITLDMGGTSADTCLVRSGRPSLSFESQVDGLPIRVPTFDIEVVGAGGGSIAWIDRAGLLHVGPESAGADPGPCCYGRGGKRPTITDANVLLGLLRPSRFFGGRMRLDIEQATASIEDLAERLGLSTLDCAEGIRRIADSNMIATIRLVSVARGHDPRDFSLLAFGGAGGLHACNLAQDLDIATVLVPERQGVLSALGLLVSDVAVDLVQSLLLAADETVEERVAAEIAGLSAQATETFANYGVPANGLVFEPSLDMRYVGQASELNLSIGGDEGNAAGWLERFHEDYLRRYGHSFSDKQVEIVNVRLHVHHNASPLEVPPKTGLAEPSRVHDRIYCDGHWQEAVFLWRPELGAGFSAEGPLVVEESHGTTFVPEGWAMRVDDIGTLVMERSR